jgi:hypothetical protein
MLASGHGEGVLMDNNDLAGWMTQIIGLHSNLPVQTVYYGAIPKTYSFSGENEPTGVVVKISLA